MVYSMVIGGFEALTRFATSCICLPETSAAVSLWITATAAACLRFYKDGLQWYLTLDILRTRNRIEDVSKSGLCRMFTIL